MKRVSVSANSYITRYEKNVKKLDDRVKDYLRDPDEENIHDLRTAIRRFDASVKLLPRKLRTKSNIQSYKRQCRQLFRIHTKVRDCDIIISRLDSYHSHPAYAEIMNSLHSERNAKLASAYKVGLSLRNPRLPKITVQDISTSKLQNRLNRLVRTLNKQIERNIPIVLNNIEKVEELHQLRKDYKRLRYLLELASNRKKTSKILDYLREIQDLLGDIHDLDIMMAYLNNMKVSLRVDDIIYSEKKNRNQQYQQFVQFFKGNTNVSRVLQRVTV